MTGRVRVWVEGRPIEVPEGASASAAVEAAGIVMRAVHGGPRGPVCGIGHCMECRIDIEGRPHQRACLVTCREGMRIGAGAHDSSARRRVVRHEADLLVVGAGPAGIGAALAARERNRTVLLVHQGIAAGGQGWRTRNPHLLDDRGIQQIPSAEVTHRSASGAWIAETFSELLELRAPRVVLATGARELLLPFPGWTLPGVVGAGGLQALVRGGFPVAGRVVVLAGTGPLLLAAAATLRRAGAQVAMIAEQADPEQQNILRSALVEHPRKAWQALGILAGVRGVPVLAGTWPISVESDGGRLRVGLRTTGGGERAVRCDLLACGFGLVPNTELAAQEGCALTGGHVSVDATQATTVPGIYSAGEATGVGGAELAFLEGTIAGHAAAGRRADRLFRARSREERWAGAVARATELRGELKTACTDETLVCRCEGVSFGRLRAHGSWREARLHTRCGMGSCQGRTCGPATTYLLGWAPSIPRPPGHPVSIEALAAGE